MASELLAGLSIFKTMFDTAKGLKDINDVAVRNAAVVELQEKILSAQAQQTALVQRIGELEKEVASFEAWEREKERYVLTDFGSGTFAYLLKQGMERGEPPHRICATCYQDRHKAILQFQVRNYLRQDVYHCPRCKVDVGLGTPQEPPRSAGDDGDWRTA